MTSSIDARGNASILLFVTWRLPIHLVLEKFGLVLALRHTKGTPDSRSSCQSGGTGCFLIRQRRTCDTGTQILSAMEAWKFHNHKEKN